VLIHSVGDKDNISSTLLALIGQNYPNFDIYYANLDKNQNSQKIAESYQDPKLHILDVGKPKAGWSLQAWASEVLLNKSDSELVVLLGADTILLPNTLSVIASMFDSQKLELASLLPADQNKSFWQQLIMSQEHYLLFGLYPAAYITNKYPRLATAYSSLVAFKRDSIKGIGGFEIVKNSPLEDLDIANKAKQSGLVSQFYSASDLAVSQNRSSLRQLRDYNEQRLYPSLQFNMPLSVTLVTTGVFVISFPIALLTILLVLGIYEGTVLLAAACTIMIFNRLIIMSKSKQSIAGALLYPLGSLILLLEIFSSMSKYEMKKPRWEKRRSL
jgi:GT2 family glycosyltransferase